MEKIINAFSTLKEGREEKSVIYASYIDILPVSASRVSRELSMTLTSMPHVTFYTIDPEKLLLLESMGAAQIMQEER